MTTFPRSLYYDDGATTQQVSDAFNAGVFYGIYSGHGGNNSWADGPPFSETNVNNLTNTNMYPFVMSFACVTGSYQDTQCFTETWSRAPNKGALAIYGSSVNSYWTEDDVLERRLFRRDFRSGRQCSVGSRSGVAGNTSPLPGSNG